MDKNGAHPVAVDPLKADEQLPKTTQIQICEVFEQLSGAAYSQIYQTTDKTRKMNMIRKGQVQDLEKDDVRAQIEFVSQIFGGVA